jgi:hypothetical protein
MPSSSSARPELGGAEAPLPGTERPSGSAAWLGAWLPNLLFGVLVVIDTVRLLRHAMWRDEIQAFMIAATSATPVELFAKLKYEGHPGLWHLLLWVITRFSSDPFWMQVLHLVIALGIWLLIWRASPFRPVEKLLLLLSYYLFWEYFVVSRSYALGVLLGFGYVALRTQRPTQRFWPWVLLGLLANTTVFGAIWSLGMAAFFALGNWREWRAMVAGAALYAALVVLAIATMMPAPDVGLYAPAVPKLDASTFDTPLHYVIGAFLPWFAPFVSMSLTWVGGKGAALAATPFGKNPLSEMVGLVSGAGAGSIVQIAVLAAPPLACFSIVRDRARTAEFAAIYLGALLFALVWNFPGAPRHFGFLFVALIGTVWMWRSTVSPAKPVATLWLVLLMLNAIGGLTTLSAGLLPYSQSRNAATWLESHHLEDAFLIGSRDATTSPITGYLRRPLYYLECECFGTYVEWSSRRKATLDLNDIVTRVARGMAAEHKSEAILISNRGLALEKQTVDPNLVFAPIKRFPSALAGDETYVIYRVRAREMAGPAP